MKRTNVVIDEKLVERCRKLTGVKSTREIIDLALNQLLKREQQRRLAAKLRGSGWVGDLAEMRDH